MALCTAAVMASSWTASILPKPGSPEVHPISALPANATSKTGMLPKRLMLDPFMRVFLFLMTWGDHSQDCQIDLFGNTQSPCQVVTGCIREAI